ncbi:MAG: PKD domain-containing protein [Salibacteraceae bacterium]
MAYRIIPLIITQLLFADLHYSLGQCQSESVLAEDTVCANSLVNVEFDSAYSGAVGINLCANEIDGLDSIYSLPQLASQIPGTVNSASLVQDDDGNWYGFLKAPNLSALVRLNFGQDLRNIPSVHAVTTTATSTLNTGSVGAIKFLKINDVWHGVTTLISSRLGVIRFEEGLTADTLNVHLIFDSSVLPNPRNLDVEIVNDSIVVAVINSDGTIGVLNFGDTLFNPIYSTYSDPIDPLDLSAGRAIEIINECGNYHVFATGITRRKLNHLYYGNSLHNTSPAYTVEGTNLISPVGFSSSVRGGKVQLWLKHSSSGFTMYEYPLTMDSIVSETLFSSTAADLTGEAFDIVSQGGDLFAVTVASIDKIPNIISFESSCLSNTDSLVWTDSISTTFSGSGVNWGNVILEDHYGHRNYIPFQTLVNESPNALFSLQGKCLGDSSYFTDQSSSNIGIQNWNWNFGDSNASIEQNPAHLYQDSGHFSPSLLVTDSNGCSNTVSDSINIRTKPAPNLTIGLSCQGKTTVVEDVSQYFANTFYESSLWIVNGSDTLEGQEIEPVFLDTGEVELSLITTSTEGCSSRLDTSIQVLSSPILDIEIVSTCFNDTAFFVNETTSYTPFESFWSFGDGDTSTVLNPEHHYVDTGNYQVIYAATTTGFCSDTLTRSIRISAEPMAQIALPELQICSGEINSFIDNSVLYNDTMRESIWQLYQDTLYGQTVNIHTPFQDSSETLFHEIIVGTDCRSSVNETLTIIEGITPQFSMSSFCAGDTVYFANNSMIPANQNLFQTVWSFGNGDSSNQHNTQCLYSDSGSYQISMKQITDSGCVGIKDTTVSILSPPVVDFEINGQICTNSPIAVDYNIALDSQDSMINAFWVIGHDTSSLDSVFRTNIVDEYLNISMIVQTKNGCIGEYQLVAQSFQTPIARVSYDTVCAGLPTQFYDLYSGSNYEWQWAIDSQYFIEQDDPSFVFMEPGAHQAVLTITDIISGCFSDDTAIVAVSGIDNVQIMHDSLCSDQMGVFFLDAQLQFDEIENAVWKYNDYQVMSPIGPFQLDDESGVVSVDVTTKHGCKTTASLSIQPNSSPKPQVEWAMSELDSLTLDFNVTNGQYFTSLGWSINSVAFDTGNAASFAFDSAGFYQLLVEAMSKTGCVSEVKFVLNIGGNAIDLRLISIEKTKETSGDVTIYASLVNSSEVTIDSFELILRTNQNVTIKEAFILKLAPGEMARVRFSSSIVSDEADMHCVEIRSVNNQLSVSPDRKCLLDITQGFVGEVFPNPATNSIALLLGDGAKLDVLVEIIEATGRTALRKVFTFEKNNSSHELEIDVKGLNPGIYFVVVKDEGTSKKYIRKFIKI